MEGPGSGAGSGAVQIKNTDPCADPAGPKTYGSRSGADPDTERIWNTEEKATCLVLSSILSVFLPDVPKRAVPRGGAALAGLGNRKTALGTVQVRIPGKKDFVGEIHKTTKSITIFLEPLSPTNYKLGKTVIVSLCLKYRKQKGFSLADC
jgi:hypothetical protein